ncbi:MAG: hypothetical protein HYY76_20845 [Acidobacteria bacterium]|nr:hypothetical protein [Acidobacteriota bacterium]
MERELDEQRQAPALLGEDLERLALAEAAVAENASAASGRRIVCATSSS